jgi:hypothetical protein
MIFHHLDHTRHSPKAEADGVRRSRMLARGGVSRLVGLLDYVTPLRRGTANWHRARYS